MATDPKSQKQTSGPPAKSSAGEKARSPAQETMLPGCTAEDLANAKTEKLAADIILKDGAKTTPVAPEPAAGDLPDGKPGSDSKDPNDDAPMSTRANKRVLVLMDRHRAMLIGEGGDLSQADMNVLKSIGYDRETVTREKYHSFGTLDAKALGQRMLAKHPAIFDAKTMSAEFVWIPDLEARKRAQESRDKGAQKKPANGEPAPVAESKEPPAAPPTPQPPPAPEWKVLEPQDQTDPVPHELHELRVRANGEWTMMAASLRGRLHAHKGMWREDAYAFDWLHEWTIIVLSDGAGSAKFARIASKVACEAALESMKKSLHAFHLAFSEGDTPTQADQDALRRFLKKGAADARHAVIDEKDRRRCAVRDLNATFLLMVYSPFKEGSLVAALQVGDGALGVHTEDDSCTVMGSPDHGEFSSETRFLTDAGLDHTFGDRVQYRLFKKPIRALAVMCDGVSDDFFPEDKRLNELFIGNPISELKTKKGESVYGVMHKDHGLIKDPQDGKALLDWLRYEKRGSSDDRTLVLMYRSEKK